ncbi:hypothetical protein [Streptomyces sp. NPDC052225]|uniref:hypothetical protein n=1 Tax=Streptomyces sp. NPDC052225 TaxID=3154949 RepID=UPI0034292B57
MDQSLRAERAAPSHPVDPAHPAAAPDWESDLPDLTLVPLTDVEGLSPLPATARILEEVLRPRGSMRGGGEPGRAE